MITSKCETIRDAVAEAVEESDGPTPQREAVAVGVGGACADLQLVAVGGDELVLGRRQLEHDGELLRRMCVRVSGVFKRPARISVLSSAKESSHSTHAEGEAALGIIPCQGAGDARLALRWIHMRRLVNADSAPSAAGDGDAPSSGHFGREGATRDRDQDARCPTDDREEKTAEVNGDEELFASGHFPVDDGSWDGLETAYNFHLQLAPGAQGVSCPICLRVTQFPVRQDCGHVLCWSCMQQSLSSLGDCPLCQAQQIFKAGKSDATPAPETEHRPMGFSFSDGCGDFFVLCQISSVGMLSGPYQSGILQVDQMHYTSNTTTTAVSTGYDASRGHHDLLPNSSDVPLQLDNLSDLDDVIDLDDLVSSDSERPSPAVAARTSISGNFIPGPVRHPRMSLRKMSSSSFGQSSSTGETIAQAVPRVTRLPASQVGKRKARSRKINREELSIAHMEWETVRSEGTPPDQRYDCGLAIYGGVLIVVGGIVGKLRLNDLHVLDLATQPPPRWIKPPISGTPPPSGNLLQIFVIRDDLYAIGGTIDGKFLTELHRLNLKSGEWRWERLEVAGTPPSMRYWYSLIVLQGMAILYGGYGHPQRLSDTFALRFDSEIPTWTELQPRGDIPGPSSTHSVCVVNDRMYIFGGYDGKYRRGQLFAFEIEVVSNEHIGCVWRKVETQGHGPASRYTHSGASIGSQLIVYGGNTGCLKGDAYVLDLENDEDVPTWKLAKCDPPLTRRAWHRAVVYNGAMYVFGGRTAEGNDNKVTRVAFHASPP
ncbi:Adagio protein 3 [Phytophthora pseudosyringae]|uniref:Adagio protein 3 n=1 Tax=Phytophthora pseudosyringae TaxID=221518 RepID=A0A8T1WD20_9STRA|nr:Adagio protein 3 [Phytophthora pseudosyringae]